MVTSGIPDGRENATTIEARKDPVGYLDINSVSYFLPDGRPLLRDVSLKVGENARVALIGPNGAGKPNPGS